MVGVDIGQVQETQEIRLETAEDDIKAGVKDDTGDSSIFRPAECKRNITSVVARTPFFNKLVFSPY